MRFFHHPAILFTDLSMRTVQSDVLQGFLIGFGLSVVTAQVYGWIKSTRINGWTSAFGLGVPGNGILLRAAHALLFPGPVVVPGRGDVLADECGRRRQCCSLAERITSSISQQAVFSTEQCILVDYHGRREKSFSSRIR